MPSLSRQHAPAPGSGRNWLPPEGLGAILERLRRLPLGDVPVRDEEMIGCNPAARRWVSGHGDGCISGGTHATRFIPSRTAGRAARHAVVFERPGWIKSLVFERQKSSPPCCAALRAGSSGVFPSRSVTTECRSCRGTDHLPVAPHSALVKRRVAGPSAAPEGLQEGAECAA
jgi:hypothetical protein